MYIIHLFIFSTTHEGRICISLQMLLTRRVSEITLNLAVWEINSSNNNKSLYHSVHKSFALNNGENSFAIDMWMGSVENDDVLAITAGRQQQLTQMLCFFVFVPELYAHHTCLSLLVWQRSVASCCRVRIVVDELRTHEIRRQRCHHFYPNTQTQTVPSKDRKCATMRAFASRTELHSTIKWGERSERSLPRYHCHRHRSSIP